MKGLLDVDRKVLDPSSLSICVFGMLTPEDEEGLQVAFGLEKLEKDDVFGGGY